VPPRAKKEPAKPVEPEFDPFSEPDQDTVPDGDEAQTELPPPWEIEDNETDVNPTVTEKKAEVNRMAESKIVVTIKGGRDFDEPWIVVHADDLDDALAQTTDKAKLGDLMKAAQEASKAFRDFRPAEDKGIAPATSQGASQPRSQGRPPAANDGPLGPQHCKHGQKKFWSKYDDQKNEMVQIYFCPAPKGAADKCKNQYVN
jgi:hypothetical protein